MQTIEKVKELAKGYDIVPVFRYGYDRFSKKCAEVGIDGFIIPDMPYEQSIEIAAGRKRLSSNENNSVTVFFYICRWRCTGDRKMNELAHKPQSFT